MEERFKQLFEEYKYQACMLSGEIHNTENYFRMSLFNEDGMRMCDADDLDDTLKARVYSEEIVEYLKAVQKDIGYLVRKAERIAESFKDHDDMLFDEVIEETMRNMFGGE